jgi:hypothetical protein
MFSLWTNITGTILTNGQQFAGEHTLVVLVGITARKYLRFGRELSFYHIPSGAPL